VGEKRVCGEKNTFSTLDGMEERGRTPERVGKGDKVLYSTQIMKVLTLRKSLSEEEERERDFQDLPNPPLFGDLDRTDRVHGWS